MAAKKLIIVTGAIEDENGAWPLGKKLVEAEEAERLVAAGAARWPTPEESKAKEDTSSAEAPEDEDPDGKGEGPGEDGDKMSEADDEKIDWPTSFSRKETIVEFMEKYKIPYDTDDNKKTLMQKIDAWREAKEK